MSPMRDEDLLRDPAIRQAVAAQHAAELATTQSYRWLIGWLVIAAMIGVLLILLISSIRLAG